MSLIKLKTHFYINYYFGNKKIMNNLLENFKAAKQALYDHVGFVEDWVTYPIEDYTDYFWDNEGNYITFF